MATVYAAYNSVLYVTGTSTATTYEACTDLGGNVHQITDTAKQIIDPAQTLICYSDPTRTVRTPTAVNYVYGKITFGATYTTVEASYYYLPLLEITTCRVYDLTFKQATDASAVMSASAAFDTDKGQLKEVTGKLDLLEAVPGQTDYDPGAGAVTINSLWGNSTQKVLALTFGSTGLSWRGFIHFISAPRAGNPNKNVRLSANFAASPIASTYSTPASWAFSDE